ncbi:MAG: RecQ family ATP-dependent DNA helicase [Thermomicrobiales bacterium]
MTVQSAPNADVVPAARPGPSAELRAFHLTSADLSALPAKLVWAVVGRLRGAGDYQEAARLLELIEATNGESLQVLEERARLAFLQGDSDRARDMLQRRVARAPSPSARAALARLYLESGDLTKAAALSAELARGHPDLITISQLSADVAKARGDIETARTYYLGVLDAKPDSPTALLTLAKIAADERDLESAKHFLRRALSVMTETATSNQLRAAASLAVTIGDEAEATALEQRAEAVDDERSGELLTSLHEALGDRAPAEPADELLVLSNDIDQPSAPDKVISPDQSAEPVDPHILTTLRDTFGHKELRPGQAAVIKHVMAGKNVLAVMPTGSGKSLTFQLPAMLTEGTTLVISPLIALMKDQLESLPAAVQERTALINSTLSSGDIRRRLDDLRLGKLKLVYVAPERLRHHAFLDALRTANVARVVVDEAHCISLWGHDFRPDYLSIPTALQELGAPPVVAITATATQAMARQIAAALKRDMELVRLSVFRPNLFYEVINASSRDEKIARVAEICRQERGAGIIYVSSRRDTERIATLLRDRGVSALHYHAGMDPETRAQHQDRFMRGHVRVMVATIAFGMGVDKADVRFIIHFAAPRSLEAYAQESGRAGRDGQQARCVLVTAPSDKAALTQSIRRDQMSLDALRTIYVRLRKAASGNWAILDPMSLTPPAEHDDADDQDARVALGLLEQARLIHRHPDAPISYALQWLQERSGETAPPAADNAWDCFSSWLQSTDQVQPRSIRTAATCAATGLSPIELDRLLASRSEFIVRDNSRAACLELLPATGDTARTMTTLLEKAHADAKRRVDQVIAYARGRTCRHAAIAAHLGERLDPCKTSCDVCTVVSEGRAFEQTPVAAVTKRAHATADDALAVLTAMRTLPYPLGKPGLVSLLLGSMESRIRPDRSASFGVLKDVQKSKVEQLVDRLAEEGYLFRDMDHDYKLISLTKQGSEATVADLAAFNATVSASTGINRKTGKPEIDLSDLSPADADLCQRLFEWRRARASTDAVPPYVVAHNTTLVNIAVTRPTTLSALTAVPGLGPAKVEKYGRDLLKVITGE